MDNAADNDDEMYFSYISKGRLVSMDDVLWGTGDYDSLGDTYVIVEVPFDNIHSWDQSGVEESIAVEVVDSDDMAVCAEELRCNGDMADSKRDIVIIPATEDVRDDKWLLHLDCTGVNLLGKKLGADVKECKEPMNNYSGATTLGRVSQGIYCRHWFDRGKWRK